jgi:hypothetical protein
MSEPAPDSDGVHGILLTWSEDMRIAVVFSKQQAAAAEAKMGPALLLCINIPTSALLRSADKCGRFDEKAYRTGRIQRGAIAISRVSDVSCKPTRRARS